jgi:hypothetical protein
MGATQWYHFAQALGAAMAHSELGDPDMPTAWEAVWRAGANLFAAMWPLGPDAARAYAQPYATFWAVANSAYMRAMAEPRPRLGG